MKQKIDSILEASFGVVFIGCVGVFVFAILCLMLIVGVEMI